MNSTKKIAKAMSEIERKSAMLRVAHRKTAARLTKVRRILSLSAAVLSLLTAGSIASTLSSVLHNKAMQIIGVVSSILAAIAGGVSTYYFSDEKILEHIEQATAYLRIRDKAKLYLIQENLPEATRLDHLMELQKDYAAADEQYSLTIDGPGSDKYYDVME